MANRSPSTLRVNTPARAFPLFRGTQLERRGDRRRHRWGSCPRQPVSTGPGRARSASRSPCGKFGQYPSVYSPGDVLYADSAAGSTEPQLLYQAIGAGNLRAFVDGQDNVGHGALSN
jgi:hypothetical protein